MFNWIKKKAEEAYIVVASQFTKVAAACFGLLGLGSYASAQTATDMTAALDAQKTAITDIATGLASFASWGVLLTFTVGAGILALIFVLYKLGAFAKKGKAV